MSANDPYQYGKSQYNPNEFNSNGDSYNGTQGAGASTANSFAQSNPAANSGGGKASDPFAAMLNHATALNQFRQGQNPNAGVKSPAGGNPVAMPHMAFLGQSNEPSFNASNPPAFGVGGGTSEGPSYPDPSASNPPSTGGSNPPSTGGDPSNPAYADPNQNNVDPNFTSAMYGGAGGATRRQPSNPTLSSNDRATEWSKNSGYEWLAGRGDVLDQYYDEVTRLKQAGAGDVDFVDWLHHKHPNAPNPLYKGSGQDTYAAVDPYASGYQNQNDDPSQYQPKTDDQRFWESKANTYAQTAGYEALKGRGDILKQYYDESEQRKSIGQNPFDFIDWLHTRYPDMNNPQYKRSGTDTYNNGTDPYLNHPADQNHDPNNPNSPDFAPFGVDPKTGKPYQTPDEAKAAQAPTGQPGTPGPPPDGANPFTPGPGESQPPGPTPTGSQPPVGPTGVQTPGTPDGQPSTGLPGVPGGQAAPGGPSDFEKSMQQIFGRQQDQLARKMNAQAALTGQSNSGGYGTSFGNAEADLMAQQSGILADKQNTNYNSALDRALDLYKANQSNTTQRYSIDTQKEIALKAQDLQKYGVDLNDVLQRYQINTDDAFKRFKENLDAETQKQVATIGAAAANSAAAASSAVANAAAQTQLQAAKINAETQRYGIDVDREHNILNYVLGTYGLGNDAIKNIIGTGNGSLISGTPFPTGNVVVKP